MFTMTKQKKVEKKEEQKKIYTTAWLLFLFSSKDQSLHRVRQPDDDVKEEK
jgi:hypothetical protein